MQVQPQHPACSHIGQANLAPELHHYPQKSSNRSSDQCNGVDQSQSQPPAPQQPHLGDLGTNELYSVHKKQLPPPDRQQQHQQAQQPKTDDHSWRPLAEALEVPKIRRRQKEHREIYGYGGANATRPARGGNSVPLEQRLFSVPGPAEEIYEAMMRKRDGSGQKKLLQWQKTCLRGHDDVITGNRALVVCAPTGGGKTVGTYIHSETSPLHCCAGLAGW
jgi:hypothetical protein